MKNHFTVVLLTMVLVSATLACKLLEKFDNNQAKEEGVAATPPASAPAAPSVALSGAPPSAPPKPEPVGLFADKLPAGLVPVDRTPVSADVIKEAVKLEDNASKARKAKDYTKATELYMLALKRDPGFPDARYNLARTLILDNKVDAGLAVLDQLYRVEDCFRCEGLLLRAAQEEDFSGAKDRAEFKERTDAAKGVGKRLPTISRAAKEVIAWLHAPRLDNMPPVVDHRTHIVLQTPAAYHQLRGAGAFIEFVIEEGKKNFPKGRKWGPSLGPPLGMSLECKGTCCDVNTYDPPNGRSVLRELCFKHQGNAAVALYKVKVD